MPRKRLSEEARNAIRANVRKAQAAANTPEVRAKAAATMRKNNAAKRALLAHTKITPDTGGVPLDMIPDKPHKKRRNKANPEVAKSSKVVTRQEVVLALLRYLNGE